MAAGKISGVPESDGTKALQNTKKDIKDSNDINLYNKSIRDILKDALRISVVRPALAYFFLRTIRWQKRAARIRSNWEQQGIHVPPFVIFSITDRFNLQCKGCFAQALNRSSQIEMGEKKLRNVVQEAKELGISAIIIAGGEPLLRPEIFDITKDFPEVIFPICTNGLLIDEELVRKLKRQRNVVVLISLEGYELDTDERRGKGVYQQLLKTIKNMNSKGLFYGVNLMVTRPNFATVTDEQFIKGFINLGCRVFTFLEYSSIEEGTEDWILTDEQRNSLPGLIDLFRSKFPGLFISISGIEEKLGGCMSAGRGIIHINAEGNIEPCPFVPYSDTNLRDLSLKEALQSGFLRAIRQNIEQLDKGHGGCILWENRERVQSLLHVKSSSTKSN